MDPVKHSDPMKGVCQMTKIKLTKTAVEKIPHAEKGKQIDYYDSELDNFGIRVSHTGKKYFVRRYIGTKRVRVMIGSHPVKTAEDARSEAIKQLGAMESGHDPNKTKRELIRLEEEAKLNITVQVLVSDYIEKHAKKFKRSWQEDERILHKELLHEQRKKGDDSWSKRRGKGAIDWSQRKAVDISKRDIVKLLEGIIERGSPGMSNNTFQVVRKMFNFAVERDILPYSPCTGVKALAPKVARDRALSADEIKTLWPILEDAAISDEIIKALKLILITVQRPGEVIGIHTNEIEGDWWTIPSERSKNGKAHRVFLVSSAKEIIDQAIAEVKKVRKIASDVKYEGHIFPCPHKKKVQSIDVHAVAIAVHRNLALPLLDKNGNPLFDKDGNPVTENRLKIDHFTPHDLRRTGATFMAQANEMDEVIDAVLNHAKQGVIKVYNQYRYDLEKQKALETWERKLDSIITGKGANVIPITSGKKAA
jgi:integrase